jgi:hypothetical protein
MARCMTTPAPSRAPATCRRERNRPVHLQLVTGGRMSSLRRAFKSAFAGWFRPAPFLAKSPCGPQARHPCPCGRRFKAPRIARNDAVRYRCRCRRRRAGRLAASIRMGTARARPRLQGAPVGEQRESGDPGVAQALQKASIGPLPPLTRRDRRRRSWRAPAPHPPGVPGRPPMRQRPDPAAATAQYSRSKAARIAPAASSPPPASESRCTRAPNSGCIALGSAKPCSRSSTQAPPCRIGC